MKTGVECEYFLDLARRQRDLRSRRQQSKPCYDQQALMRRYDVVAEICDAMVSLGWKPYQNDHEDANGQFEMNWHYDSALRTADKHAFFKYMVKSIAEKHGLARHVHAKAVLQPHRQRLPHAHFAVEGRPNVFADPKGELGMSPRGYHFIGGIMHSAEALCAITNPVVNSVQAHQCATDAVGRDLVAQYRDLHRQ